MDRDVVLPAAAHDGDQVCDQVLVHVQLQVGHVVLAGHGRVRFALAAHHPVQHRQHHRRVHVNQDGVLALELLQINLGQGHHVALGQSVGKLVVALLLHAVHFNLAGSVEQGVDSGVNHPGVALKDAVEHLQPVLRELARAVKVIFAIFFLSRLLFRAVHVQLAAAGCVQQGVYLTL